MSASFLILVCALGGAFFLAPIASFAMTRSGSASALALGVATAGQLTCFGAWSFALQFFVLDDWHAAFQSAAAFIGVMSLLAVFILKPATMVVTVGIEIESGRLQIRHLFVVYLLVCLTATEMILYLNSPGAVASGFSIYVFSSSALLGRLLVPGLFDIGWRRSLIVLSGIVFALGIATLWFALSLGGIAAAGFGYGALLPVLMTFIYLRYPNSKKRSSYEMFAYGSVGILGAPFLGRLLEGIGLPDRSFVVWSAPLAILIVFYFLRDRPKVGLPPLHERSE